MDKRRYGIFPRVFSSIFLQTDERRGRVRYRVSCIMYHISFCELYNRHRPERFAIHPSTRESGVKGE